MELSKIHHNMIYDEFGKKDYEGYILLFVFMLPSLSILAVIIWLSTLL